MKDTKRALRRHHRRRMIARALRSYKASCFESSPEERLNWARHNHNHLQMCSCYMCGNRRKWLGPTMQERRHQQRERERLCDEDEEDDLFPDFLTSAE